MDGAKPGDVPAATRDDFEENQPLMSSMDTNPPPTTIPDTLKPDLSEYQPGPPAQITPSPTYQFQPSSYYPTEHPPHVQFSGEGIGGSVEQQPAVPVNRRSESEKLLIFSVVMTIVCTFCGLPFLICTVPAVALAICARTDDRFGDIESARNKKDLALILNVAAIFLGVVAYIIYVVLHLFSNVI